MPRTERLLGAYANALLAVGGGAIVLMMVHITGDVLGRYLADRPITGTMEMVTHYYMVAAIFLPLPAVQRMRGQIAVDLFTQGLGPRARAAVDAFADLVGLAFVGALLWFATDRAILMTAIGEEALARHFPVPIWPGRWLVTAGAFGLFGYLALQALDHLRIAFTGRRLLGEPALVHPAGS